MGREQLTSSSGTLPLLIIVFTELHQMTNQEWNLIVSGAVQRQKSVL